MDRDREPDDQYRVTPHVIGGRIYAITQLPYDDPSTGERKYLRWHWGTVSEDLVFIPGTRFYEASPEVRSRLVFPDSWDTRAAERLAPPPGADRPSHGGEGEDGEIMDGENTSRMYGDVWLLERVADVTGLRGELEAVFDGDRWLVDDVLTLAMFPYLSRLDYDQVSEWQRCVKTPSSRLLTPSAVTRIFTSITEERRLDLLGLRAAILGEEELCSVDTTSGSAYGFSDLDISHGKNKEDLPSERTIEVVVYSLTSHLPVYYNQFPGNMTDSKSLEVILTDLDNVGFEDLVFMSDRGYESIRNLELLISRGLKFITAEKTSTSDTDKILRIMDEIPGRPKIMTLDPETGLYYKQYPQEMSIESRDGATKQSDRLTLNLYFDGHQRVDDLRVIDKALMDQEILLNDLMKNNIPISNDQKLNLFSFYEVNTDPVTNLIDSFEENYAKRERAIRRAGFFAIKTYGIDFDAMRIYHTYRLRDEQEKFFNIMKTKTTADNKRYWTNSYNRGRLFIKFIELILVSHVENIWRTTKLKQIYDSPFNIMLNMRSIRYNEHAKAGEKLTPFVGTQIDVCEAFGVEIPKGRVPADSPGQIPKRGRGRPPKNR